MEYVFDEVESCEMIGEFKDEYVYDIEVNDETHTFIGNDILVHNSLFVSFKPAIRNCEWKNLFFDNLDKIPYKFIIILPKSSHKNTENVETNNISEFAIKGANKIQNCLGQYDFSITEDVKEILEKLKDSEIRIIADGSWIKNKDLEKFIKDNNLAERLKWNWDNELDLIQGIDYYRYAGYFKDELEKYANTYGLTNKEDFELERISESVIYLAKKKYIQHIVFEDGINYERFKYIYPKGVELVRRSTPLFARDKILIIIKYLFNNPENFNIKELLKLVKNLKREFDLCVPDKIDEICMQSSCSKYSEKVLEDKNKLLFVSGAHFAVKAAAYYNHLLYKNKELQSKYEFLKSGSKIKYYYCKNSSINNIFAYTRGSYPVEFAPEIDLTIQFAKSILSPINSIIKPLKLPEITARLSIVMDIFGGTLKNKKENIIDDCEEDIIDKNDLWWE